MQECLEVPDEGQVLGDIGAPGIEAQDKMVAEAAMISEARRVSWKEGRTERYKNIVLLRAEVVPWCFTWGFPWGDLVHHPVLARCCSELRKNGKDVTTPEGLILVQRDQYDGIRTALEKEKSLQQDSGMNYICIVLATDVVSPDMLREAIRDVLRGRGRDGTSPGMVSWQVFYQEAFVGYSCFDCRWLPPLKRSWCMGYDSIVLLRMEVDPRNFPWDELVHHPALEACCHKLRLYRQDVRTRDFLILVRPYQYTGIRSALDTYERVDKGFSGSSMRCIHIALATDVVTQVELCEVIREICSKGRDDAGGSMDAWYSSYPKMIAKAAVPKRGIIWTDVGCGIPQTSMTGSCASKTYKHVNLLKVACIRHLSLDDLVRHPALKPCCRKLHAVENPVRLGGSPFLILVRPDQYHWIRKALYEYRREDVDCSSGKLACVVVFATDVVSRYEIYEAIREVLSQGGRHPALRLWEEDGIFACGTRQSTGCLYAANCPQFINLREREQSSTVLAVSGELREDDKPHTPAASIKSGRTSERYRNILLLRVGDPPKKKFRMCREWSGELLRHPELQPCCDALLTAGKDVRTPEGALILVWPDQYDDVRRALAEYQRGEDKPITFYHIILAPDVVSQAALGEAISEVFNKAVRRPRIKSEQVQFFQGLRRAAASLYGECGDEESDKDEVVGLATHKNVFVQNTFLTLQDSEEDQFTESAPAAPPNHEMGAETKDHAVTQTVHQELTRFNPRIGKLCHCCNRVHREMRKKVPWHRWRAVCAEFERILAGMPHKIESAQEVGKRC